MKVAGTLVSNGALFNGPIKITDGSQGMGKVLVSGDDGLATWKVATAVIPPAPCSSTNYDIATLDKHAQNNTMFISTVAVLQPGTYSFAGTGTTRNDGGGGVSSVFISQTLYANGTFNTSPDTNYPAEIRSYVGTTSSSPPPDVVKYYSASTNPKIVYAVTRYGSSNPTTWTIPTPTNITVTQTTYMYLITSQASNDGFLSMTRTDGGCSQSATQVTPTSKTYSATFSTAVDDTRTNTSGVKDTGYSFTFTPQVSGSKLIVDINAPIDLFNSRGQCSMILSKGDVAIRVFSNLDTNVHYNMDPSVVVLDTAGTLTPRNYNLKLATGQNSRCRTQAPTTFTVIEIP